MSRRLLIACLYGGLLTAAPAAAQPRSFVQDSTLNNLIHAPGYQTAPLGQLGAVVEAGRGPIDMVLVSGFGLGVSAFEEFMRRNADRYHMFAVTLPGFEGTPAPPMPPPGTSYGDQTWTRSAIEAVTRLVRQKRLEQPVMVGFSINGTQVAMGVALEHPELVRAVVLLSGTPRLEPARPTKFWPNNLTLEQKVRAVDQYSAPKWFKTVTRETWVKNNFPGGDYSVVDSVRGKRFADRANEPPLPVLIRYLCEFHASDLWPELGRLKPPLLLVEPLFTESLRADTTRSYLQAYFETPWNGRLENRPHTEVVSVPNAGVLVMDDQPAIVDRKVAEFLAHTP